MIDKGLDVTAADMIGNYVNMNGKEIIHNNCLVIGYRVGPQIGHHRIWFTYFLDLSNVWMAK